MITDSPRFFGSKNAISGNNVKGVPEMGKTVEIMRGFGIREDFIRGHFLPYFDMRFGIMLTNFNLGEFTPLKASNCNA